MSIIELTEQRREILDCFNAGDGATDLANMDRLYAVEDSIEKAPIITDADKLAAAMVLLGVEDPPDFADSFEKLLHASLLQSI